MTDFKDEHSATLKQAVDAMEAVRKIVKPHGYNVGLYGSTTKSGKGHDVDLICVPYSADLQLKPPDEIAMLLIARLGMRIRLYEQLLHGDASDVFLCMVAKNGLYLDIHIRGEA